MIVYGDVAREAEPRALLRAVAAALRAMGDGAAPSHDRLRRELIALGEAEAAIGDALCPREDRDLARLRRLRRASIALGSSFWLSWTQALGEAPCDRPVRAAELLDATVAEAWPRLVRLRPAEGYAHYALYPESYGEAAARLLAARQPAAAAVIGIRSIGTSLSAVVAAVLQLAGVPVESWCVRPHGHPFSRELALHASLATAWRRAARTGALALVVDEGPGLSGSSFLAVSAALQRSGFPESRILLMPSWNAPAPPMAGEDAARRWDGARKWPIASDCIWWRRGAPAGRVEDLSAGKWRQLLLPERHWPPVQPQHESRKYLVWNGGGLGRLWKFAGLGAYGDARLARAELLSDAGFIPRAHALQDGFLVQDFVPGRPLRAEGLDVELASRAVDYLAFRACAFPTGRSARMSDLTKMLQVNLGEGLGPEWELAAHALVGEATALGAGDAVTVATDGRMMPHEWLRTQAGFIKADAVDHADDHFFPRDQDIAWDVAGFAVEFALSQAQEREMAEALAASIGDRYLPRRVPFYRTAYLAYQLGYSELASAALAGDPGEARRFRRRADRLRAHLRAGLAHLTPRAGRMR